MNISEFIKPDRCHEEAIKAIKPSMSFDENCDLLDYKKTLRAKFF